MRENPEHMKQLEQLGVEPIDMVVINLYPFRATIEKPGVTFDEAIENIDIGGPTMLRAAAKNAQDVVVCHRSGGLRPRAHRAGNHGRRFAENQALSAI